jgi:Subtilase family
VWAVVAASIAGVLLVALAWFWQAAGWITDQVLQQFDLPVQWWIWPLASLILLILAAVPALLLWTLPRSVSVREAGRAWFWAAIAAFLGGLLRAIPDAYAEAYLGSLAIVFAALAFAARRPHGAAVRTAPAATPLAVVGGGVMLLPWMALGALGGLLETALAVFAAAATGWLVSSVLDGRFWAPYAAAGRIRLVMVGGLVAGVLLLLIAAGMGESGTQLTAMLALPPLGFAAAALAPGSPRAAGWLAGLAALGPLAFADSQELSLFLLGRDIPYWIGIAALASLVLALLLGLVYGLTLPVRVIPAGFGAPSVGLRPRRRLVATGLAVVVLLGAGSVYAFAGQPGLHGERLFVVMKEQASLTGLPNSVRPGPSRDGRVAAVYERLTSHANATQADLRKQLKRWHVRYTPYYLVNGILVDGGPLVRAWLSQRSDVDRVLLDPVLRPLPAGVPVEHGDLPAPQEVGWNIEMVGAPQAWQRGITGRGIVVGSSDSGVDGTHPALRQGFRGGDDSWFDPWSDSTTPNDHNGHGTHTLATAVGRGGIGVAPDAEWIGCVNLERNLGSPSRYLDCLQFMLAPFPHGGNPFTDGRPARAPHVLTNSWGCPLIEGCDAGALRPAVQALAAAGIAVVVAAGNSGPLCNSIVDPPATYDTSITVAAVNQARRVTDFSSRGPRPTGKPDLAAPGDEVVSAMPGNTYAALSGTSMAAPHVAGLIALLWSQRPELIGDLATTRGLILDAATPAVLAASGDGSLACGGATGQVGAGIAHTVILS